jgi:hypothetical protein
VLERSFPRIAASLRAPRHRDHPLYAIVITCCTAS